VQKSGRQKLGGRPCRGAGGRLQPRPARHRRSHSSLLWEDAGSREEGSADNVTIFEPKICTKSGEIHLHGPDFHTDSTVISS